MPRPPRSAQYRRYATAYVSLGLCSYCGAIDRLTRDHVVPRSRKSTVSSPDNQRKIVMCCRACNRSKANLTIDEWIDCLPSHLDPAQVQRAVCADAAPTKLVRVPSSLSKRCLLYAKSGFRVKRFALARFRKLRSTLGIFLVNLLGSFWPVTANQKPIPWQVLHANAFAQQVAAIPAAAVTGKTGKTHVCADEEGVGRVAA